MTISSRFNVFPETAALYVHVPFCRHRCGYCDFSLVANRDDLQIQYLKSIELELQQRVTCSQPELQTLFLGGGTPSQLSNEHLKRLIELIAQHWTITDQTEFSIEANPFDLTDEKLQQMNSLGINRISVGVQSFDDDVLTTLERDHKASSLPTRLTQAREIIGNLSIDLIFAVPGQSMASWQHTLDQALAIAPDHLSTYGLTFEKGTSFWSRREKGTLLQQPEALEAEMYELAISKITAAGFLHYEVSNFAIPGKECRHNLGYWTGKTFAAVGPGAAAFDGTTRATNHRSFFTWMKRLNSGSSPVTDLDELTTEERAREQLVVGLRLRQGIERTEFLERTERDYFELAGEELQELIDQQLLSWDAESNRLCMSEKGLLLADTITVALI